MSKVVSIEKANEYLERFMNGVVKKNPGETEFHQAVYEVAQTIFPFIADKPRYHEKQILERLAEPDRILTFRVAGRTTRAGPV